MRWESQDAKCNVDLMQFKSPMTDEGGGHLMEALTIWKRCSYGGEAAIHKIDVKASMHDDLGRMGFTASVNWQILTSIDDQDNDESRK